MKLAAAALALVFLVPGLAQSQAPAPPYLLDPGELPPTTSTPGSYPSATAALGHKHPECLAIYGKTPAQIEATPCSVTENLAANSTLSACSHNNKIIDFQGDNITIDCVKWSTGPTGFGTRCENSGGCKNLTIRRSTITGNNGACDSQGLNSSGQCFYGQQSLLKLGTYTGAIKSILVEKSDISRSDIPIAVLGGPNGDVVGYPGQGNKAVIIRGNRIHAITQVPGAHTDLLTMFESPRGVLIENNLFDGSDSIGGANVGSNIQVQTDSTAAGNFVFRNNHIISDTNGTTMNLGPATSCQCPSPIYWENNKVDFNSDTAFAYGRPTCSAGCPTLGSDSNHTCTGNTFEDGTAMKCTSSGR